jgi:hypothetical protein
MGKAQLRCREKRQLGPIDELCVIENLILSWLTGFRPWPPFWLRLSRAA